MGKPFKKELELVNDTIFWTNQQNVDVISKFLLNNPITPLYIVGSGGSLSACYHTANLYQKNGGIAKAITPLELYYSKKALRNSKVLFISASGKNTDILFAFDVAIKEEPISILTISLKKNTPLTKRTERYSISKGIEYEIPSKKDGFLATNSLICYFTLLCKAFDSNQEILINSTIESFIIQNKLFVSQINSQFSYTVLYGGLGQAVAYDIESKFTEAALGNILLSDYRNFGHGRHHWFAKRDKQSAIIALITPIEKKIAYKTLSLIPEIIPKLVIESNINSSMSSLELLIKSFQLVHEIGNKQGIDPGRPGVPEFGSKLYHLKYSSFYKIRSENDHFIRNLNIIRKSKVNDFYDLTYEEQSFWIQKYETFEKKLRQTVFGILIFDYDGTLCSSEDRYKGLSEEVKKELLRLLNQNIVIGIATGRGKSVREAFEKWVPKDLKQNIILGYYNGADVGSLLDKNIPYKNAQINPLLTQFSKKIEELKSLLLSIELELRPNQLTIRFTSLKSCNRLKNLVRNLLNKSEYNKLEMLESSHSVDIIIRPLVSKLNIIKECLIRAKLNNKSSNFISIGDKGKWPGNDYQLLSVPFALSVDEVSDDPETCWNLSSYGIKNIESTLEYLSRMVIINGNIQFQ